MKLERHVMVGPSSFQMYSSVMVYMIARTELMNGLIDLNVVCSKCSLYFYIYIYIFYMHGYFRFSILRQLTL